MGAIAHSIGVTVDDIEGDVQILSDHPQSHARSAMGGEGYSAGEGKGQNARRVLISLS